MAQLARASHQVLSICEKVTPWTPFEFFPLCGGTQRNDPLAFEWRELRMELIA